MSTPDIEYNLRRAREARDAASCSTDITARAIHLEMAADYERRADRAGSPPVPMLEMSESST